MKNFVSLNRMFVTQKVAVFAFLLVIHLVVILYMTLVLFLVCESLPTVFTIKFPHLLLVEFDLPGLVVLDDPHVFPLVRLLHVDLQVPPAVE